MASIIEAGSKNPNDDMIEKSFPRQGQQRLAYILLVTLPQIKQGPEIKVHKAFSIITIFNY